jgi:hypothetical protein
MKHTQQQEVENIVDTLMAELIDAMGHSQSMHKLKTRLLVQLCQAQRDLEQIVADGEYVYDGVSY